MEFFCTTHQRWPGVKRPYQLGQVTFDEEGAKLHLTSALMDDKRIKRVVSFCFCGPVTCDNQKSKAKPTAAKTAKKSPESPPERSKGFQTLPKPSQNSPQTLPKAFSDPAKTLPKFIKNHNSIENQILCNFWTTKVSTQTETKTDQNEAKVYQKSMWKKYVFWKQVVIDFSQFLPGAQSPTQRRQRPQRATAAVGKFRFPTIWPPHSLAVNKESFCGTPRCLLFLSSAYQTIFVFGEYLRGQHTGLDHEKLHFWWSKLLSISQNSSNSHMCSPDFFILQTPPSTNPDLQ